MCTNSYNKKLAGAVYGLGPGGDEVAEAKTQAAENAVLGAGSAKQEVAAKTTTPAAEEPAQPKTVAPTDVGNTNEKGADAKNKKKRGYQATRVAEDRNVLTDTVSGEKKTTLG